jgi:hypothetical protein
MRAGDDQDVILREIAAIKAMLATILDRMGEPRKEWHTTREVADALGLDPYTVRKWCRYGRVRAEKRSGDADEWVISDEELTRVKDHGLLPLRRVPTASRSATQ